MCVCSNRLVMCAFINNFSSVQEFFLALRWCDLFECLMVFTHVMLASVGISCRYVSVCLPQVGVLLKWLNIGSHKQRHTIAQGLLVFGDEKRGKTQMGSLNGGARCRWGRLNAGAVAENLQLDTKHCQLSSVASLSH